MYCRQLSEKLNVAICCRAAAVMQRETVMSGRINNEIEECIRNNVTWQALPRHLQQVKAKTIVDQLFGAGRDNFVIRGKKNIEGVYACVALHVC